MGGNNTWKAQQISQLDQHGGFKTISMSKNNLLSKNKWHNGNQLMDLSMGQLSWFIHDRDRHESGYKTQMSKKKSVFCM